MKDLCDLIETYLPAEDVKGVYRAYLYSAEAHNGQHRQSGEPYIFHPIAVAYRLAEMRMDAVTLMAALLHDVLEDTRITRLELSEEFGEEVTMLVDGVSKLARTTESRELAQAASFQKMLLAMARDVRVIIIKLADRLHNMRTLGAVRPEKRRRIARETLEIYVPVASRLSMNTVRVELEELCFKTLYPRRQRILRQQIEKLNHKQSDILQAIQTVIEKRLAENHIQARVECRHRHLFGIYSDMCKLKQDQNGDNRQTFRKIMSRCSLRVIVENIDNCYRTLGILHNTYKPATKRFKDFIAIPKINGYQSLHTELVSPHHLRVEVQIRTADMHTLCEGGIVEAMHLSSHNDSQSSLPPTQQRTRDWLHSLMNLKTDNALEFLENVKMDLFPSEVYVFTPKGDIMQLPVNATAIDFAYAIHSDVGNKCIAVKIDEQYSSLDTRLKSGQTVEVLMADWARATPQWLNFAVTARARTALRQYLKHLQRDEACALGQRLLDKELQSSGLSVENLTEVQQQHLLKTLHHGSMSELLTAIGLGDLMAVIVARELTTKQADAEQNQADKVSWYTPAEEATTHHMQQPLLIRGTEGSMMTFSHCCRPLPGDDILGYISHGRGILVHNATCRNALRHRHNPEKWIPLQWSAHIEREFLADIMIYTRNQPGALAAVAINLSELGVNIEDISTRNLDGLTYALRLCLSIRDRNHLAAVLRHLRRVDSVVHLHRPRGEGPVLDGQHIE